MKFKELWLWRGWEGHRIQKFLISQHHGWIVSYLQTAMAMVMAILLMQRSQLSMELLLT